MPDAAAPQARPTLILRDLGKTYPPRKSYSAESDDEEDGEEIEGGGRREAKRWALSPLNLNFYPGERVGLIGPHGAGKTSVLRLLAGTLLPNEGEIIRDRACLLNDYQTPFLPDASLRRNLTLIAQLQEVRPADLLERLEAIEALAGVPVRLDVKAGAHSKIAYARIGIAAALACAPNLILIDNTLGPAEPDFRDALEDRLAALCDEGAILFFAPKKLAHLTPLCRRALWLDAGALIQDGAAADIAETYLATLADEELEELAEDAEEAPRKSKWRKRDAPAAAPHAGPARATGEEGRFGNVLSFATCNEAWEEATEFNHGPIHFRIELETWQANQAVDMQIELMHANMLIAQLRPTEPYDFPTPGKRIVVAIAPANVLADHAYTARLKASYLAPDGGAPLEMLVRVAWFDVFGEEDERARRFERSWPPKRKPLTMPSSEWRLSPSDTRGA